MIEELTTQILQNYPILAPILFILIRSLPVIIPPIPGIAVDIVGIALFGWLYGLVLAGTGVTLGAMVAFFIARHFRGPFVARFTSLQKVHEWEKRFSEKQKFWNLVWLRILTGPFFDYISYSAGLTKMKTSTFFWSTVFAGFPMGFVIYYFGGASLAQGPIGIVAFLISIGVLVFLFRHIAHFQQRKF